MKPAMQIILSLILMGTLLDATLSLIEFSVEDISQSAKYSDIIGRKYLTRNELIINGVTKDPARRPKKIDYYTIHAKPGIGGREVLSNKILKEGSLIKIKKVVRYHGYFGVWGAFHIEILFIKLSNKPIKIDHHKLLKKINNSYILNPEYFEEL